MNNLSSVTCYLLSFFAFVSFSLVPGIRVCRLLSIEVATSELLDCAVLFLDPFKEIKFVMPIGIQCGQRFALSGALMRILPPSSKRSLAVITSPIDAAL